MQFNFNPNKRLNLLLSGKPTYVLKQEEPIVSLAVGFQSWQRLNLLRKFFKFIYHSLMKQFSLTSISTLTDDWAYFTCLLVENLLVFEAGRTNCLTCGSISILIRLNLLRKFLKIYWSLIKQCSLTSISTIRWLDLLQTLILVENLLVLKQAEPSVSFAVRFQSWQTPNLLHKNLKEKSIGLSGVMKQCSLTSILTLTGDWTYFKHLSVENLLSKLFGGKCVIIS